MQKISTKYEIKHALNIDRLNKQHFTISERIELLNRRLNRNESRFSFRLFLCASFAMPIFVLKACSKDIKKSKKQKKKKRTNGRKKKSQ